MLTWWYTDDRWVHSNTCCKIRVVMTKSHLRRDKCSTRALLSPPVLSSLSVCLRSSLFPSLPKLREVFTWSASIRIKLFSLWVLVFCKLLCIRSDKMRSMIKLLSRCVFERVCTLAWIVSIVLFIDRDQEQVHERQWTSALKWLRFYSVITLLPFIYLFTYHFLKT